MSKTPEPKSMQDFRKYLREITAIQSETVRRLVADDTTPPLEVAAVLEDIANVLLDVSDEIRDFALGRPGAVVPFSKVRPEEVSSD